jgi:hypothetical protein
LKVFHAILKPIFKHGKAYPEQLENREESIFEIPTNDDDPDAVRLFCGAGVVVNTSRSS